MSLVGDRSERRAGMFNPAKQDPSDDGKAGNALSPSILHSTRRLALTRFTRSSIGSLRTKNRDRSCVKREKYCGTVHVGEVGCLRRSFLACFPRSSLHVGSHTKSGGRLQKADPYRFFCNPCPGQDLWLVTRLRSLQPGCASKPSPLPVPSSTVPASPPPNGKRKKK